MKLDQIIPLIIVLAFAAIVFKMIVEHYDEIEFDYDPSTGRQTFKARKNRLLGELPGMILEGN